MVAFKKFFVIGIIAAFALGVTGCGSGSAPQPITQSAFAMDTIATLTVYGDSQTAQTAIDAALERLEQLEGVFSYTRSDSELSRLNATAYGQAVEVGDDMGFLIQESLRLSELTEGAFDISIGALVDLWSVPDSLAPLTPETADIAELLPNMGYGNIIYQNNTLRYANPHIKMHFGAIAKGYAVDELVKVLERHGVTSAFVDIGGEIGVIGNSPRNDGVWRIGIRDPFEPSEIASTLTVSPPLGALATSGNYERPEHILEPATGRPAQSEFASVTVVSHSGTLSDALSTAFFVMGKAKASALAEQMEGVDFVYIEKLD